MPAPLVVGAFFVLVYGAFYMGDGGYGNMAYVIDEMWDGHQEAVAQRAAVPVLLHDTIEGIRYYG